MRSYKLLLFLALMIPATLSAQVRINEVLLSSSGNQVELKNFGDVAVDVSGWFLCSRFNYPAIATLTVLSGSRTIPPGGLLALGGLTLNNASADLGLYTTNSNFAIPDNMEDFVQWGGAGNGRESVAATKGIWSSGDFVPAVVDGHSIEYDGSGNSPEDWFDQDNPTIGAENGVVTGVEDEVVNVPSQFNLEQNYPNPFNPSTVIHYTLPQNADLTAVKLDVYNILGQKVRTLVNENQSAGPHAVLWNGKDDDGNLVAGGIYLYRLQARSFSAVKKMTYLR
ncbi:MAG: FlgD immunoglobulin-like domain containing protein [bacterium]